MASSRECDIQAGRKKTDYSFVFANIVKYFAPSTVLMLYKILTHLTLMITLSPQSIDEETETRKAR